MSAENSLQTMADAALSYIRVRTDKGEKVHTFVVVQTHAGVYVHVPAPFKDEAGSAHMIDMLKLCFSIWQVKAYVMAFEAWMVNKKTKSWEDIRKLDLSKDPTRRDGIMFAGTSRTDTVSGFAPIARYGNEIAVGPVHWHDQGEGKTGGVFFELLPPENLGPPPPGVERKFYEQWPQLRLENHT